jgi:alpha-glucosidase
VRSVDVALAGLLALWGGPAVPPTASPAPAPAAAEAPAASAPSPASLRLKSPSGHIDVQVRAAPDLAYDVTFDGRPLLTDGRLSLDVDHHRLGAAARIKDAKVRGVDTTINPAVRLKAATLADTYNELRIECAGGYAVTFRAYDQGVAYRFETALEAPQVKVFGEEALFRFAADAPVFYPDEGKTFFSHNEQLYKPVNLTRLPVGNSATLPAVVATTAGPKVAIAEADIESYPGCGCARPARRRWRRRFPPYPLEEKATRDRDVRVVRAADYIAVTSGTRAYPWRIIGVAATDADLITNSLVYLLQRPTELTDTSWIKPGKVAWDWWNDRNLAGVASSPASTPRPTSSSSTSRPATASSTSSSTRAGTRPATF